MEINGGALAVLALLYYLDDNGITLWVLLACLIHEMGHWWAIRACGGKVVRLRLSCAGAELRLSAAHPLSAWGMIAAALAGPAVNLAAAWLSIRLSRRGAGLYFFAGINLGLACFNMLPAERLDGGRALKALLGQLIGEEPGGRAVELCSCLVTGALLAAGALLLWQSGGKNFTLLIAGLWMAAIERKEQRAAVL